jgi:spore maturation protein B
VKLFYSSAATGLILDIFLTSRSDSYAGMLISILISCTETVFYTMSVDFPAAKVTKPRFTLTGQISCFSVDFKIYWGKAGKEKVK